MSETAHALSIVETLTPAVVFQRDGGVEDIIGKLESDVRAMPSDPTTEKGRKELKSRAYQVSRSKTLLDDMGKAVQEDAKRTVDRVNADRRIIRERLDALRDEVRAPADEFDRREAARVEGHKDAVKAVEAIARFDMEPDEAIVAKRQAELADYAGRDWQEFSGRGAQAYADAKAALDAHAQAATARRIAAEEAAARAAHEAEQERLRAEEMRVAREAEIARQAAERERVAAEERAVAAKARADAEKRAAEERAQKAEQARIDAERRAEAQKKADAERAERERVAAVEAERRRAADEAARIKAEEERRAANKAHCARINREVLDAMTGLGLSDEQSRMLISAIVRGEVPHVSLAY